MTGLTAAADDSFLREGVFRFAVIFINSFSNASRTDSQLFFLFFLCELKDVSDGCFVSFDDF